uniref:Endo/exonuclease/phosphatase domain-containing protein n=1 Tax=Macrostomum lignano TaxID=282301 RepID=A0A1I8IUS5_9PLAT
LVLAPLVLAPLVLAPWCWRPWCWLLVLPLVLAPCVLVLVPLVLAPLVLAPLVLAPLVLAPLVLAPLVLAPCWPPGAGAPGAGACRPWCWRPWCWRPGAPGAGALVLAPGAGALCWRPGAGAPGAGALVLAPLLAPLVLAPLVLAPLVLAPLVLAKAPAWLSRGSTLRTSEPAGASCTRRQDVHGRGGVGTLIGLRLRQSVHCASLSPRPIRVHLRLRARCIRARAFFDFLAGQLEEVPNCDTLAVLGDLNTVPRRSERSTFVAGRENANTDAFVPQAPCPPGYFCGLQDKTTELTRAERHEETGATRSCAGSHSRAPHVTNCDTMAPLALRLDHRLLLCDLRLHDQLYRRPKQQPRRYYSALLQDTSVKRQFAGAFVGALADQLEAGAAAEQTVPLMRPAQKSLPVWQSNPTIRQARFNIENRRATGDAEDTFERLLDERQQAAVDDTVRSITAGGPDVKRRAVWTAVRTLTGPTLTVRKKRVALNLAGDTPEERRNELRDFFAGIVNAPTLPLPAGPLPASLPLPAPGRPSATDSLGRLTPNPAAAGGETDNGTAANQEAPLAAASSGRPIRSRQSSGSSIASDASFFSAAAAAASKSPHTPLPSLPPAPSGIGASVAGVEVMTKQELFQKFLHVQSLAKRYKSKFYELMEAHRSLDTEKEKLKKALTTNQDKSLRRISELKEQIELDQLAKRDLEQNYSLMLEEKDELNKVLKIQVSLLKEGKDLPPELEAKIKDGHEKEASEKRKMEENLKAAQEKNVRLEQLLTKCRDSIQSHKEKLAEIQADKEALRAEAEAKMQASKAEIEKLTARLAETRQKAKQATDEATRQLAESKATLHASLQEKEELIDSLRQQLQTALGKAESSSADCRELSDQLRQLQMHIAGKEDEFQLAIEERDMAKNAAAFEGEKRREELQARVAALESAEKQYRNALESERVKSEQLAAELADRRAATEAQMEKEKSQAVAELESRLAQSAEQQASVLSELRAEFAQEQARLRDSLTEQAEAEKAELTAELEKGFASQFESEKWRFQSALAEKEEQIDYLKDLSSGLETQLADSERRRTEFEYQLERLRDDYNLVCRELDGSRTAAETAETARRTAEDEADKRAEEAEQANRRVTDLQSEVDSLTDRLSETANRLSSATSDRDRLSEELNSVQSQLTWTQHRLEEQQDRVAALTEEAKAAELRIAAGQQEATELKARIGHLIGSSEDNEQSARKQMDSLREELDT